MEFHCAFCDSHSSFLLSSFFFYFSTPTPVLRNSLLFLFSLRLSRVATSSADQLHLRTIEVSSALCEYCQPGLEHLPLSHGQQEALEEPSNLMAYKKHQKNLLISWPIRSTRSTFFSLMANRKHYCNIPIV